MCAVDVIKKVKSWLSSDHDTLEFCQFVHRHLNAVGSAPALPGSTMAGALRDRSGLSGIISDRPVKSGSIMELE